MNYEVLARKWRPHRFCDVKGQDHVVRAIKGALRSSTIGHAYLFSGTRGIGKTSIARIFAKAINCKNLSSEFEPCLNCSSCLSLESGSSLDYQEIDGASHNGVENIRSLIDKLPYLPTDGKYKVYVIDEVHMLSNNAFNALLKSLEEPPSHVVFIFATTDPEKLLPTVLSRCQRFDLRPMSHLMLSELTREILDSEGIKFENEEVLKLVCQAGRGSVRDTLTLIEQLRNFSGNNQITEEGLLFSLGLTKLSAVKNICRSIWTKNTEELTSIFNECLKENIDIENFSNQILDFYYEKIQESLSSNRDVTRLISIYQSLSVDFKWALGSFNPENAILISLQKSTLETRELKKTPETKIEQTEVKKEATVIPSVVSRPVVREKIEVKIEEKKRDHNNFNIENFLDYLKETRAASAANLELGNLLNFKKTEHKSEVIFGFGEKSRLMYDYFQEKDVFLGIKEVLARYFEKPIDSVSLKFEILTAEEERKISFRSLSEISQNQRMKTEGNIKQNFLETDPIKKAEKLFGVKLEDIRVKGEL